MARLTIGGVASETGCNIETIRYYEKIGLLAPPERSEGGHRQYSRGDIERLAFIRRARELGFALDDIRSFLALTDSRALTCAEVKAITLDHLAAVERKIADLGTIASVLRDMAAQCDGGTAPVCPIISAIAARRA